MIYANISSHISNKESLEMTIGSIYNQVDYINLYLTGYEFNPFLQDKINVIKSTEKEPNDNGKFFFLDKVDGFYFCMNDDIIYPPNYVKEILPRFSTYDIICCAGKNFRKFPILNYEKSSIDVYHYSNKMKKDKLMQFPNTGTVAFHVNDFKISYDSFDESNMADVIFGCLAKKKNKIITCLKREKDWIVSNNKVNKSSIDPRKTIYVNENFK